jgi:MFS family permease
VPAAYLLTYGGLMLFGGRVADLFGHRRVLLVGTGLVAVGSLAERFGAAT